MGYTLDEFFSQSPEKSSNFYFPDDRCDPDVIFFVEFENKITVPVFVQIKLHYIRLKQLQGSQHDWSRNVLQG